MGNNLSVMTAASSELRSDISAVNADQEIVKTDIDAKMDNGMSDICANVKTEINDIRSVISAIEYSQQEFVEKLQTFQEAVGRDFYGRAADPEPRRGHRI